MSQPQTLNCPMCGAPAPDEATTCHHCGARLASVACPACFGMMFLGSKFCPRCGALADRAEVHSAGKPLQCPRCQTALRPVLVGATPVQECAKCDGLWVDTKAFEGICSDRERQEPVLGRAALAPSSAPEALNTIRYVPCPTCQKLMNRVNFAGCSGVIVDVCRSHGTWFDPQELTRIVEFIRAGGLDLSRERKKAELAVEERRLRRLREAQGVRSREFDHDLRGTAIWAVGDSFRGWFG